VKARIEWKSRLTFAEIAEALEIDSDEVMAATPIEDGFLVLYTTNTHAPEAVVHDALLGRDDSGILRRVKHRTLCPLSEFMARLED
jgi:hypothetical protein